MRQIEEPIVTKEKGPMDGERVTHPAFGQITVTRVSGGAYLYGSDFQHQHYVTLAVQSSELVRSGARDWHFGKKELIEVAMTFAQWATFVSSFNQGSGVPCTIERYNGQMIPGLPAPQRTEKFKQDVAEDLAGMLTELQDLKKLVTDETTGLSKKKQEAIVAKVDRTLRTVTSSIPYVQEMFNEHMEETIEQSKVEVHGYMEFMFHNVGVEAIRAQDYPLKVIDHAE